MILAFQTGCSAPGCKFNLKALRVFVFSAYGRKSKPLAMRVVVEATFFGMPQAPN